MCAGTRRPGWAVVGLAIALGACTQPRLRNFLPAGAGFTRTFGQLFDDAGTRKASHYAVVSLSGSLRTLSTGTIEYVRGFDGMGNCVLLRPKKYLTTPNDTSKLRGLPKPGALVVGYCNLDEAGVRSAVQALYAAKLSAAEAPAATTQFLDHAEGFRRIDVSAHESDPTQSTAIGTATGGTLFVAAFTETDDGTRRYVNPLPYLAGAIQPPSLVDAVAPTLDEILLETSASGTFGADRVPHPASGGTIGAPLPRDALRVAVRTTERTTPGGALVVPYRIRYELALLTLSGTTVVSRETKSRGVALLNTMALADGAPLGGAMYEATSDPTNGPYWIFLPYGPTPAEPGTEPEPINALDPATPRTLDLAMSPGGADTFPTGSYELVVTVEDAVNAPAPAATRTVRFELAPGGAPAGDGVLTYAPVSGPIGTRLAITAAAASFASDTTVEFTGTFDPEGLDLGGSELPPTSSFTVTYPSAKVSIADAQHLTVVVGEVLPPLSVLTASSMRLAQGGRLFGSLRVRTPSTGFDHTTASVGFTVVGSVRFGQVVGGVLEEPEVLPILHATSAAEVAAAPDFQRLVAEWRVPAPAGGAPPASVSVQVVTLDVAGAFLDTRSHTLELVEFADGVAVYRSAAAGGRRLVLVDAAAFAGPHGADLLAVHAVAGGAVRLDGSPPP